MSGFPTEEELLRQRCDVVVSWVVEGMHSRGIPNAQRVFGDGLEEGDVRTLRMIQAAIGSRKPERVPEEVHWAKNRLMYGGRHDHAAVRRELAAAYWRVYPQK